MPNDKQSSLKNRYTWLLWPLIIIIVVAPRVLGLDVFYARDEITNWNWSDEFTVAVWQLHPAETLTKSNHPGIPLFWTNTLFIGAKSLLVSLFPEVGSPIDPISGDHSLNLLAERRLIIGLLGSLQVVLAVWLVRRLWDWRAALLSVILLGLDPFNLSEARVFRFEMVSAMFACLTVLAYLTFLQHRNQRWLWLSGILGGLAVSSKVSAGLMTPYIWLLLLLDFLLGTESWSKKFKQIFQNGLIWATAAVGTFYLIWPAMWVSPIEAVTHLFKRGIGQVTQNSVWHGAVFFWGQLIPDENPGPLFYPVVYAFRTTPLVWLGSLIALILLGGMIWFPKAKLRPNSATTVTSNTTQSTLWGRPYPAVAGLLLLAYVVLVTLELSMSLSKVDRYLILTFPMLNIFSALGLSILVERLTHYATRNRQYALSNWLSAGLLSLILIIQLTQTVPAHPYYFTYWNPLVGGGRAAMETLPVGSGEGIDQAVNYLNSQPGAAEATLVCGGSKPWCDLLFNGETVRYASYSNGDWIEADYASFYISHLQRQNYPTEIVDFFMPQTPLYQVDLQGATYVWVYNVPEITHFAGPSNDLAGLGQLLGYNLSPPLETGLEPGQALEATIWWINRGAGVDNLALRLVDESGYEWARARAIPWPEYSSIPAPQYAVLASTASLTVPPGAPPGLYFLRTGILEAEKERLLGQFTMPAEASRLAVTPGQIFTDPDLFSISEAVNQPLAPEVTLLGFAPPEQVLTAESPTWLTLYWQATAAPPDYLVDLCLLDDAGQEVKRWQGQPGYGHYPTHHWQAGEIVQDVWALQVEPETPVGQYSLEISLLNPNHPESQTCTERSRSIQNPKTKIQNLEVWPQPISYDAPNMQAELQVNFGDRLTLLGYDLYFDVEAAAGTVSLSPYLYWQSQLDFQERFDVILTLRNADTDQVIEEWRVPLGINQAKAFWKAGEVINPIYQLETRAVIEGRYHLDIALQEQAGGQTEPVKLNNGLETTFTRLENIQNKIVVRVN